MADAFLSYSRAQRELTEKLAHDLSAAGISVWWDTSALPADAAQDEVESEIAAAKAVVILWSDTSIKSRWTWAQADLAASHQKLINVHALPLDPSRIPQPFHQPRSIPLEDGSAIFEAMLRLGVAHRHIPDAAPDEEPRRLSAEGDAGAEEVGSNHPPAEETSEAEEEHKAFAEAKSCATAGAFCKFLAMYPDGEHAAEARALHKPLAAVEAATGVAAVDHAVPLAQPAPSEPAVPAAPQPTPVPQPPRRKLLAAVLLIAAAIFVIYLIVHYNSADAHLARGDSYSAKGDYADATSEYGQAIRIYNNSSRYELNEAIAYQRRAELYVRHGEFNLAISDFGEALSLDPRNDLLLMSRGDAYRAVGDIEHAVTDYTRAIEIDSTDADTLVRGAQRLVNDNSRADALRFCKINATVFNQLARAQPGNAGWKQDLQSTAEAFGGLSWDLVLHREFASALEAADAGIAIAPNKIWIYTNRAHALMFLGRIDEARALYRAYRNEKNVLRDGTGWQATVLQDFADLRKAGLTRPLMDEIERQFR